MNADGGSHRVGGRPRGQKTSYGYPKVSLMPQTLR